MVAQNSWITQDIDGQEVRLTHANIEDSSSSMVHLMGTLELDGAWHNIVAQVVVTATGVATVDQLEVSLANGVGRPSAWATEGARETAAWIGAKYHEVHIARTLVAVAA